MLRRLLGIFVLLVAVAVVVPVSAQPDKEKQKAVDDAKAALEKAEKASTAADKALADNKDDAKKADLKKAADAAKTAVTEAKAAFEKAEKAAKPPEKSGEKAMLKWKLAKDAVFYQ